MRRLLGAWLVAGFCFAGPAAAADDGHVALVKNVTGSLQIVRGDVVLEAAPGATLQATDRIVTGPNASGGIVFRDGTLVTVGASTEVRIRDYVFEPKESKYLFSMYLAKGTAVYSSGKIGKLAPESVRVDTPTATVGVRGTRFILTAE